MVMSGKFILENHGPFVIPVVRSYLLLASTHPSQPHMTSWSLSFDGTAPRAQQKGLHPLEHRTTCLTTVDFAL